MNEDDLYRSLFLYYGREKFYSQMQNVSLEGVGKFINDYSFRLFNGFSLVLQCRLQEGIRELSPIQKEREFALGAILALIYAHKQFNVIDKEALLALDGRLKQERKNLTPTSSYYAAVFLFLSGKVEKAKEYAEKVLKVHPEHPEALTLKGWCEIELLQPTKNTLDLFNRALKIKPSLDANLGLVKYYQMVNDLENALNILSRILIRHPDILVPLVEKMKTQLGNWNWEHAMETATRILTIDQTNIEALRIKAVIEIVREGQPNSALPTLLQLFLTLERVEGTNAHLFNEVAKLMSRISGGNYLILNEAYKFAEKAIQIVPANSDYITNIAYICVQQAKYKDAVKYFKAATKLDDTSTMALCGLTLCTLLESGPTEQARQQIEFLTEVQGEDTKIPLLLYMSAKMNSANPTVAVKLMVDACGTQFSNLKMIHFGVDYLIAFDAGFLLDVTKELLRFSPIQQSVSIGEISSKDSLHITLVHSLNILDAIVKACPGLVEGVYLLARVQYLSGESMFASRTLQKILQELDPSYTEAHLLMAQIHIQNKVYQRASQSLEICLSHDFKVRENPFYHLLYGIIQQQQTLYDDAIKSFTTAMSICGLNPLSRVPESTPNTSGKTLGLVDKVTLYLETIRAYSALNQTREAYKLMEAAMDEFSNTAEKGRLIISNADIFLQQGNTKEALGTLAKMQPGQPYFLQAKTKMADIYLKYRKDRVGFAQCFKELVENNPGAESYLMLGDAFMSIQEPDEAINAYKQALRQNPSDPILASKLGRAYVKTHQYKKAIAYYREAVLNPEKHMLKIDLAELYLKLRQYRDAEDVLAQEIAAANLNTDDIGVLEVRTKQFLLLARVHEKSGNLSGSLNTLKDARDNQQRIEQRLMVDHGSDRTGAQEQQARIVMSKICVLMAEQSISLQDYLQAISYYREALKHNSSSDLTIMAAMARLHMQMNEMEQCQRICSQILEHTAMGSSESVADHEAASVMMADISFRKMDFTNAAYHFSQLLLNQPLYWTALARLIEVMRRSGTLHEVTAYLTRAESVCPRAEQEAGLNYCKGMFELYTGNPNSALRFFNNSRRDAEWGPQAIFNMIEICLNPDNDLPSEGTIESIEEAEFRDSKTMALNTAERLINELKPKVKPGGLNDEALNHRLLENFLLISGHVRYSVEKALLDFTQIASQEEYKDNVGAIYGVAAANVVLKQTQRAKNQLKRVSKNPWTFEDAEYLERSWLLLADIYIQSSKYELASELLTKVLKHNKSCAKAYELSGYIAEKEQAYKVAANQYDSAWKYSGKSKPNIGYKLAFNYMKAKNYADAIDTCQQVLKNHSDYPSIKKDILDKCRNNLRT